MLLCDKLVCQGQRCKFCFVSFLFFFQSMFAVIYKKWKLCFNVLEESIISAGVMSIVFLFVFVFFFYLHQDIGSCFYFK